MDQGRINSATVEASDEIAKDRAWLWFHLPEELKIITLMKLGEDDDLRELTSARHVSRDFHNAWIMMLERKQHPVRWGSLLSANEVLQPGQLSPLLKAVYGQDKEALLTLKGVFVSTDTERSMVHWQKALILAAIEAAINDPKQIHLVHTWLDCIRPHCLRRQVQFQRLLCDNLAFCPPEAMPGLAVKVLNYLLLNKTEDHEFNLFFFFSAIAEHASLDFAKAYLQNNITWLSVFCEEDASVTEIIQSANSPAERQNRLLRARLCKLYPSHRDGILQVMPYSDARADNATGMFLRTPLETLEGLLPLLAAGAAVNAQGDDGGLTVLLCSAAHGRFTTVECLLAAGAAVDAQTNDGWTALIWAADRGHLNVVECLLAAGAAVNTQTNDGWTALIRAADRGDLNVVECLLAAGAAVDAQTNDGWTALIWAADCGHLNVVECLLAAGAAVDAQTNDGWTALIWAADRGHLNVVECLLAAGAAVNTQTNDGWTALIRAADRGHVKVIQCLLVAGAVLNLRSNFGVMVLRWAKFEGHTEIVALLKARDNQSTPDPSLIGFIMWGAGQLIEGAHRKTVEAAPPVVRRSVNVDNAGRHSFNDDNQTTSAFSCVGSIMWGIGLLNDWIRGTAAGGAQPVVSRTVDVGNAGSHSLVTNPSGASYLPTDPASRGEAAPAEATGTTQALNLPQRISSRL